MQFHFTHKSDCLLKWTFFRELLQFGPSPQTANLLDNGSSFYFTRQMPLPLPTNSVKPLKGISLLSPIYLKDLFDRVNDHFPRMPGTDNENFPHHVKPQTQLFCPMHPYHHTLACHPP